MPKDFMAVVKTTKYPVEAFLFVQKGLDFTVRSIHGDKPEAPESVQEAGASRHITGRQLCAGLRQFALEQYGSLARTVLQHWRINSSADFGRIVFAMVDAGLMSKTHTDSLEDFVDVYDFSSAFVCEEVTSQKR